MVREPVLRLCSIDVANPAAAFWLARSLEKAGARVESETLAGQSKTAIADILSHRHADLVVLVGSSGPALDVLAEAGSAITSRLALRPGEGAGCGFVRRTPVILAPPRLEVAVAVFLTLIRPCLDRLTGAPAPRPLLRGRLTRKIASGIGLTEVALLRESEEGLEPLAVADLTLSALAATQAWLAAPPESEGFAAGETVEAFAL
jgi:molybdopterin biosynthesis enzyme